MDRMSRLFKLVGTVALLVMVSSIAQLVIHIRFTVMCVHDFVLHCISNMFSFIVALFGGPVWSWEKEEGIHV